MIQKNLQTPVTAAMRNAMYSAHEVMTITNALKITYSFSLPYDFVLS